MQHLPEIIDSSASTKLKWEYITACFWQLGHIGLPAEPEVLVAEGTQYYIQTNDPVGQGRNIILCLVYSTDFFSLPAQFFFGVARYLVQIGQNVKANNLIQSGLSLAAISDDSPTHLLGLRMAAEMEAIFSNYKEILKYAHEGCELAQLTGHPEEEGQFLGLAASALHKLGNISEALSLCSKAHALLVLCQLEKSDRAIGLLDTQAGIYVERTEYARAYELTTKIVSMTAPDRSPYYHANALINLVGLGIEMGTDENGINHNLTAASDLVKHLGWIHGQMYCSEVAASLVLHHGDIATAYTAYKECLSISQGKSTDIMLMCLQRLGDFTYGMCNLENTFIWAVVYFAHARQARALGHMFEALRCLGDTLLAQEEAETALNIFRVVLNGSTEMGVHRRQADCMIRLGDAAFQHGDCEQALVMWENARPLFICSSQEKTVSAIDKRLAQVRNQGSSSLQDMFNHEYSESPSRKLEGVTCL
jgi:tetratricopeptide (TPR) repeat protein